MLDEKSLDFGETVAGNQGKNSGQKLLEEEGGHPKGFGTCCQWI